MKKQLFLALCALFVVVSSLEAAGCTSGNCRKKQRTHEERGCRTGKCGQQ